MQWRISAAVVAGIFAVAEALIVYFLFDAPKWAAIVAGLVTWHALLIRYRVDGLIALLIDQRALLREWRRD